MTQLNEQRTKVFLDRYALKDMSRLPHGLTLTDYINSMVEDAGTDPIALRKWDADHLGLFHEFEPSESWTRVAQGIANDAEEAGRFYRLMEGFKFVPGGRILSGAGTGTEVTYYNCYVIPVETEFRRRLRQEAMFTFDGSPEDVVAGNLPLRELSAEDDKGNDSRKAIFDTIAVMVDIMSRGGGVGINWSVLRPKGSHLTTVNGVSSGPVGWMDVASKAVGEVEQGGTRRGAAMFMIDDWHPDVEEFIEAKRNLDKITNANVSVAVSDAFMDAVQNDNHWDLIFPDTTDRHYDAEWDGDIEAWMDKGYRIKVYKTVKARDLWRKMAEAAWDNGEPGVVFLDRYNKRSTGQGTERIICVNPCGEQGLGAYSVCNLGAMNLSAYVTRNEHQNEPTFDWRRFREDVATAIRFLDNVVDKNFYFLPENEAQQKRLRRVGLGAMGLADALIKLGLRYGSQDAVDFTSDVFRVMKDEAILASTMLAAEKGEAPAWTPEMWDRPYLAEYAARHGQDPLLINNLKLRNLFLLTQAPTGSTSILAGVNSGIEPYFAFEYWRKDRTGEHLVFAPVTQQFFDENPGMDLPDYFVTSNDVIVEEHIAMQAAAQQWIDSSVSKTVNAPNNHTVEDVERLYTLAYEKGLKGVAYFRDGCGRDQVLRREKEQSASRHIDWCESKGNFGDLDCDCPETPREEKLLASNNELQEKVKELQRNQPLPFYRGTVLRGRTHKVQTKVGTAYVTVNGDEAGRPVEVFVNVGKAGTDLMEMGEAIGRLISQALQEGADLMQVADQLTGVGGYSQMSFTRSLPHAIGATLRDIALDINREKREPSPVDYEVQVFDTEGQKVWDSKGTTEPFTHFVITEEEPTAPTLTMTRASGELCPSCFSYSLVREEGCAKCQLCGHSAC